VAVPYASPPRSFVDSSHRRWSSALHTRLSTTDDWAFPVATVRIYLERLALASSRHPSRLTCLWIMYNASALICHFIFLFSIPLHFRYYLYFIAPFFSYFPSPFSVHFSSFPPLPEASVIYPFTPYSTLLHRAMILSFTHVLGL